MVRIHIAAVAVLVLGVAGCAAGDPAGPASDAATSQDATTTTSADDQLLAAHGLAGRTGKEIVDHLDRLGGTDRPAGLMAAVRADEVVVTDGVAEVAVALPEDEFYLSIAPFVDQTHDCFYHSLTTCQGELTEQEVEVSIVTDDGEVIVEETATTFENGFLGYWLPGDVAGTLEVTHDGRSGQIDFATGQEDPTCLTTLQLT